MGFEFVDRCSLLVLHCSHRASCWHFADALPPTPLDDTFAPSRRSSQPAHKHQRKKDLPDPTDRVGISRLVTSHSLQKTMVQQRGSIAQHRSLTLIASSLRAVKGNRHRWSAPAGWQPLPAAQRAAVLKSGGNFEALDRPMRHPCRRVVLDGVATPQECHALIQVAEAAMTEGGGGETVLICSPPTELREDVGEAAARLVAMLCWRVQAAVAAEFDEARTLYLAGAMLTRTRPPATSRAGGGRAREAAGGPPSGEAAPYDYGAPHVDRANMSSYDYSAVLYVNTKATGAQPGGGSAPTSSAHGGFDGGDFAFVDELVDEIIEPRAGRLLLFASGFEHMHRVQHVTRGTRLVLASWFTRDPSAGHALSPSECELMAASRR